MTWRNRERRKRETRRRNRRKRRKGGWGKNVRKLMLQMFVGYSALLYE